MFSIFCGLFLSNDFVNAIILVFGADSVFSPKLAWIIKSLRNLSIASELPDLYGILIDAVFPLSFFISVTGKQAFIRDCRTLFRRFSLFLLSVSS